MLLGIGFTISVSQLVSRLRGASKSGAILWRSAAKRQGLQVAFNSNQLMFGELIDGAK